MSDAALTPDEVPDKPEIGHPVGQPVRPSDGVPGGTSQRPAIGHEHPDVSSGWLRPAVFGAMDGLVSNLALIAGMAGGTATAGAGTTAVVLAGVAGLAGGAFSMAAGEFTSVASQAEYAEAEVAKERQEILANPGAETAELVAIYVEKGIDPQTARRMAQEIHRDIDRAVAVHAMEEFGVDPDSVPSPVVAAVWSFGAFVVGAAVPLAPYLFGVSHLWVSIALTLAALFACGAAVAKVTVRSWWWSGLRQMLIGGAAAAVTYALGSLVGVGLG
jgi:vacuolar iron transporter family protein